MPKIIQFFHPGPEHGHDKYDDNHKSWNVITHKRKFMRSTGDFIDKSGNFVSNREMIFWGEWEPDSKVKKLSMQPNNKYPRYIHTPYIPQKLPTPDPKSCTEKHWQNTDPFVFGDNFKYAICRQNRAYDGYRICNLEPFTLILFGSIYKQGEACETIMLDTIFVVSKLSLSRQDLLKMDFDKLSDNDKTYFDVSFRMAYPTNADYPSTHRIYTGVTYEEREQYRGMYSFAPAMLCQGNQTKGFSRNEVKLFHSTRNPQTPFMAIDATEEECESYWSEIKESCLSDTGCLATRFDMPKRN